MTADKALGGLAGTRWRGRAELWLDPLGNDAAVSDCTIAIERDAVRYTWSHGDDAHQGALEFTDGGARFTDSFHAPSGMACREVTGSKALLEVAGSYCAGEGPDWGWRIALSLRTPTGELVLQMTNVCPWGEDGRAVRMVCARN